MLQCNFCILKYIYCIYNLPYFCISHCICNRICNSALYTAFDRALAIAVAFNNTLHVTLHLQSDLHFTLHLQSDLHVTMNLRSHLDRIFLAFPSIFILRHMGISHRSSIWHFAFDLNSHISRIGNFCPQLCHRLSRKNGGCYGLLVE
jgi:hypothetical protein